MTTKQDLLNLEMSFKGALARIEASIQQLEYRMTIKLGSIVTLALAIMTAISKFV